MARKLFWSDWNRNSPKIEWSNLDGSQREIFVQGPNVKLPNSIAIDWYTDEICWADAGLKSIGNFTIYLKNKVDQYLLLIIIETKQFIICYLILLIDIYF